MPFDASANTPLVPIAAYVCTDAGADVARSVLEISVGRIEELHGGGLSGAARVCTDVAAAEIILAEIGNIRVDMATECVAEICKSGADVIVLGEQTDITTYRALIKAGALEYFTLPVSAEDILSVRRAPKKVEEVIELPSRCASIGVVGSNGGVGASLLAQNLAYHASALKGPNLRTALIDADLQFGSQAIDLDREETVGLFEALKTPARIDETFIAATMDHLTDRLSMYSHQVRAGQDAQVYGAGLPLLYPPMREEFEAIITDLPRERVLQDPDITMQLDALILVIPTGFSGVNAARRLIESMRERSPNLRIIPVLSDIRKDAKLSRKDVVTSIGHDITAILPRSDAGLLRAHRSAQSFVALQPRSPYAKAVRTIWSAALAEPPKTEKPKNRSFLKRIFS